MKAKVGRDPLCAPAPCAKFSVGSLVLLVPVASCGGLEVTAGTLAD